MPGADVPYWVVEGTGRAVTVTVTPGAMADMDTHVGRCKLYKDAAAVWGAVKEVMPPFLSPIGCMIMPSLWGPCLLFSVDGYREHVLRFLQLQLLLLLSLNAWYDFS